MEASGLLWCFGFGSFQGQRRDRNKVARGQGLSVSPAEDINDGNVLRAPQVMLSTSNEPSSPSAIMPERLHRTLDNSHSTPRCGAAPRSKCDESFSSGQGAIMPPPAERQRTRYSPVLRQAELPINNPLNVGCPQVALSVSRLLHLFKRSFYKHRVLERCCPFSFSGQHLCRGHWC